jgi:predicted phosphate transport protein (TIGR00153 family)
MKLLNIFLRKQKQVERRVFEYFEVWKECLGDFKRALELHLDGETGDEFEFYVKQTDKMESKADELRRRIEWRMYSKAMLPESRGDILGLLETMDRILSNAETILYQIQLQRLQFPENFKPTMKRLVEITCEALSLVYKASVNLISRKEDVLELANEIDRKESESDHAERNAIGTIFNLELDRADMILLKEIVVQLGRLSDMAEDVSDRLIILSVKRRV